MGQQWTKQQLDAIWLRDRSILVSAAAGSGKTAVLVERIIQRILDEKNPINLDQLLVVTFTRAAAAQMRDRIRKVLLQKIEEEPDNLRLREQLGLVPYAQISTIDSFCKKVVMDHFQMVPELDPGFRIADEGEARLLREDALDEVIEEVYENFDEGFYALSEVFSNTRGDGKIREMVLGLYEYSSSAPWPNVWLEQCRQGFEITEEEGLKDCRWCRYAREELVQRLQGITEGCGRLVQMCEGARVPAGYATAFRMDYDRLKAIADRCDDAFYEIAERLQKFEWQTKPRRKKTDDVCEEDDTRIISFRRNLQEQQKQLLKQYGGCVTAEAILSEIEIVRPYGEALIDLTLAFSERYSQMKRKKNIVDFHDIEHFALIILLGEPTEEGSFVLTQAALDMQEQFKEVMVDEYQDSNMVQEYILLAVSGELTGNPNLFMVGDVKQSIYRFRLARPQLFMDKYDSFTIEESRHQKIELQKNFRSRKQVLDSINHVFFEIMEQSLGRIDYTEDNALYAGRTFEEAPENIVTAGDYSTETFSSTELLLLDMTGAEQTLSPADGESENEDAESLTEADMDGESGDNQDAPDITKIEWEARMIAERIGRLMEPGRKLHVYDEDMGGYRPLEYSDILILLRTVNGWAEPFVKVLEEYGIPAVCENRQGYFQVYEVKVLLNCLRCIDNPHQDIPLASVLYSPIGGFSAEEMAQIRIVSYSRKEAGQSTGDLYQMLKTYDSHMYGMSETEEGEHVREDGALAVKLHTFLQWLEECRRDAVILSIHDLLVKVLRQTQFDIFVSAMPAGELRKANIDTLLNKTIAFEKTSYSGLFQFIRYVEQMEKYELDFAQLASGADTAQNVQIMSIHKSKGLEYPVVIVAGCGKQFNQQDLKKDYSFDEDFGVALSCIEGSRHVKYPSVMKSVFNQKKKNECWGEELRILYVAMTRARELLIMTGACSGLDGRWARIQEETDAQGDGLSYLQRISATGYLDWLIGVCVRQEFRDSRCADSIQVKRYHTDELMLNRVDAAENTLEDVTKLYELETAGRQRSDKTRELYEQIQVRYGYQYPYEKDLTMRANVSVSDLKHQAIERMNGEEGEAFEKIVFATEMEAECPRIPDFLKEEDCRQHIGIRGALRGTAYHTVMEHIDFMDSRIDSGNIQELLQELEHRGFLTREEADMIYPRDVKMFMESSLGRRMRRAAAEQRLTKEEQFILGLTPEERELFDLNRLVPEVAVQSGGMGEETFVMIQGIIDAYFEEDGQLILMDYKTDRVSEEHGEDELIRRYKTQLKLYDIALRRITGKPVKEWWIYSFCLKRDICFSAEDMV